MNGAAVGTLPLALTRELIRAKLAVKRPASPRSDAATARLLGPLPMTLREPETMTPAAVLVPLVTREDGMTVILTQRTSDLKAHAGQIAFPGGRMEAEDADAEAAALREAGEEIGLGRDRVEILGRLDHYRTFSGFDVTPVVGAVTPPFDLRPDPTEVADIFEVPLAFFLDAANHQHGSRQVAGTTRAYYAMPYGDRYIWGATAGMLLNLYEVLTA